ncbi:PelD GGDEF domain-containing protein [Acidithiobacillus sp. IBUN Pt1247-S3]|uniref:PelD GGDEF domain-containing protein n=1 Tax=Acidithiobacillus sp. IBUN Pt1247-S3 TaxID=3166642 RepID=UPI0034E3CCF8
MGMLTVLPRRGEGWFEAILLPVLALLLSNFLNPQDPLLLAQDFPWLLIIPLLIALRYAFLPALTSSVILASVFLWHPYPLVQGLAVAAGTVLVVLIASEFSAYWSRRETGRALEEEITATRLRQLADDLYVTRVSLDRLEQSLLYQPVSVRTAVEELRQSLAANHGVLNQEIASRVLYFLNQLAGVQVASWYACNGSGTSPNLLASFGNVVSLDDADPVWRQALAEGQSQNIAGLELGQIQQYLSVHVYKDKMGVQHCLGIEDMSFFAISRENLQIIEVLFQYLCNYASAIQFSQQVLQRWPDCPPEFAVDLLQLQRLAGVVPQVGFCIRYVFLDGPEVEAVVRKVQTLRRGLDVLWLHRSDSRLYLLVLLPFSGPSAVDGYLQRVETRIRECCPTDWEKMFQRRDSLQIDRSEAVTQIRAFLEEREPG